MVIWPLVYTTLTMIFIDNQPPSTLVRVCRYQHPELMWNTRQYWIWDWETCPIGIIRRK